MGYTERKLQPKLFLKQQQGLLLRSNTKIIKQGSRYYKLCVYQKQGLKTENTSSREHKGR